MIGSLGETIVLASHNPGKLKELHVLLQPLGFAVVPAGDYGLTEPEETENSFAGNARIKARHAARQTGLVAFSDDSGLCVDALGGAPGVHTAGWAETGKGRDFPFAMQRIRDRLEAVGAAQPWQAHFSCALCFAWPDGRDKVFEGQIDGRLVWPPRGTRGFGLDPMFVPEGHDQTFGQIDPVEKHSMSHRARAFAVLLDWLTDG